MTKPFVFSIRGEHLDEFRAGRKGWELRRRRPSIQRGERHLIYETRPVMKVVAVARIGRILVKPPGQIWELCGARSGVSRKVFDQYFAERCPSCKGRGVDPLRPRGARSVDFGCDRCQGLGSVGTRGVAVAIEMRMEWLDEPLALPPSMKAPQSWSRWKGPWPLHGGNGVRDPVQLGLGI